MRDAAVLSSLLLASATTALASAASLLECLHTRSRDLAAAASCGHEASLNDCFSNLPVTAEPDLLSSALESCFVNAGCTAAESRIEALHVLEQCDKQLADLRHRRRRHDGPVAPAAAAAREPLLEDRAAEPLPAGITAMNLPRETYAAMAARQDDATTTVGTESPSSPSPCFTDVTSHTTTCTIKTDGPSGKEMSCYPTAIATPRCRDGLICTSDARGNPSCMYKHSRLETDGIIIAIVFASVIVISVVSICFLCCRERREHRRLERAAEAARIAKEAKTQATVAAKRPGPSVTGPVSGAAVEGQPLMYQTGGAAPSSPGAQQQQFPQQQYAAGNPFTDAGPDGHPLR
ncbi:uncharacterized protein P884DRAFT_243846 [Thermothelomyces heterothallicus CBS 202.75]|uniref:uncharacterized protein n=1 Tax=Thermothelomyces heterothallicus CBS 202.75 TaxID=1149848 RepID=UPI003742E419